MVTGTWPRLSSPTVGCDTPKPRMAAYPIATTAWVSPRESACRITLRGAGNASGVLVMSTGSVSSTG